MKLRISGAQPPVSSPVENRPSRIRHGQKEVGKGEYINFEVEKLISMITGTRNGNVSKGDTSLGTAVCRS